MRSSSIIRSMTTTAIVLSRLSLKMELFGRWRIFASVWSKNLRLIEMIALLERHLTMSCPVVLGMTFSMAVMDRILTSSAGVMALTQLRTMEIAIPTVCSFEDIRLTR